jgi:hypothetical protein
MTNRRRSVVSLMTSKSSSRQRDRANTKELTSRTTIKDSGISAESGHSSQSETNNSEAEEEKDAVGEHDDHKK